MNRATFLLITVLLIFSFSTELNGQYSPSPSNREIISSEGAWFGVYTRYHFTNRWSYYGEYHLRRRDGLINMGQIYLRLGATYRLAKNVDLTAGAVNPYYWAPDQSLPNIDKVVPQFRLWEQVVISTPIRHVSILHQFRVEQRYRRDYEIGSPFELTHRYRYKIALYIPINYGDLVANTLFISLYNEIFMQTGKSITYNHFEDNRAFIGLGYKLNKKLQIQAGYMKSYRHNNSPYSYQSRNIVRVNLYHQLDLKKDIQPKEWDIPLN